MKSKNPDNQGRPARQTDMKSSRICPFCGQQAELVWVHGHGQCAKCGINSQECCSGEQCVVPFNSRTAT